LIIGSPANGRPATRFTGRKDFKISHCSIAKQAHAYIKPVNRSPLSLEALRSKRDQSQAELIRLQAESSQVKSNKPASQSSLAARNRIKRRKSRAGGGSDNSKRHQAPEADRAAQLFERLGARCVEIYDTPSKAQGRTNQTPSRSQLFGCPRLPLLSSALLAPSVQSSSLLLLFLVVVIVITTTAAASDGNELAAIVVIAPPLAYLHS